MSIQDKLLQGAAAAPGGITPSEHFGVVLYEGDGQSSHSINGGKFGAAFYGNGSNSKITFDTNFSQQTSFTISFWFNSSQYNDDHTIFQFEGDSNENSNRIGLFASGTEFGFYPHNTSGGAGRTSISTSNSSALYDGNWHHVALVIDGTSNSDATMYIDGSSKTLTTYESYTTTMRMTGDIRIGGRKDDSAGEFMEGKLDQLRIFQKALSSSEVSTLYAETASTVESLDPLSEDTTDTLQVLGDSSCTALYRFENNEEDKSGNYNGTGTAIQYAAGRYGQAGDFNGSTSAFTYSTSVINVAADHSISFWLNIDTVATQMIIWNHDSNIRMTSGGNILYRRNTSGVAYDITSSTTLSAGRWYHISASFNTSSGMALYVDNVAQGTNSYTGGVDSKSGDFGLMYRVDSNNERADGKIDQVRFFNKTISASEVTTLYNENSLVASYRFEGNANDDMNIADGTASNVTYQYGLNGFTPDFVWIKERSAAESHRLFDTTRGATKRIFPDTTSAESTASDSLTSFDTGGFTVGSSAAVNQDGQDYVAWCLKANGGTTSTGSGTGGVSNVTTQVNSQAGFSIINFTEGTGTSSSVNHGLDATPDLIITRRRTMGGAWMVWHNALSGSQYLRLNETNAVATSTNVWDGTAPDSTKVNLGPWLTESDDYGNQTRIMYAFHSVDGFSKFGSYTGNGGTSNIVETGFEPAFIMIKYIDEADQWILHDNKRDLTNPRTANLRANSSDAEIEYADYAINFLSNGFELLTNQSGQNKDGGKYIYMAFAADPDTEAPTVAKSFTTKTYTGTGSAQSIDGFGFKPNLLYIKRRTGASGPNMTNSVTGIDFYMFTDSTSNFGTDVNHLGSFDDDGFTTAGGGNAVNGSGEDYVVWAWKADDNEPTIYGGAAKAVYKFEDNANDVTTNYNGTANSITYATGKFNKAAVFNGSTGDIDLPSDIESGTMAVSLWLYSDVNAPTDKIVIEFENGYGINFNTFASGKIAAQYANANANHTLSNSTISSGQWYHIAANFRSGASDLWVNGVKQTGGTASDYLTSDQNTIGSRRTGQFFDGMIDQVRIYNGNFQQLHVDELYAETASDNDDLTLGSPPKSIVSANANAGFSIVKWEGAGGTQKIPHGLSAAPELIINKRLSGSNSWDFWVTGATAIGWDKFLGLNRTDAAADGFNNTPFGDTAPTSTVFTVDSDSGAGIGGSGDEFISYCFHSVSGYSKIGSYSGNNTGQTITTGFQPDFLMLKKTNVTSEWWIMDSVRGTTNNLEANTSDAENTGISGAPTFVSTGFNFSGSTFNETGTDWIYIAFKIN